PGHLVRAPILVVPRGFGFARPIERLVALGAASLPDGGAVAGKTLVVLSTPDVLMTEHMLAERYFFAGGPGPTATRILSVQDEGEVVVSRPDAHTLEIRNGRGQNQGPFAFLFRDCPFSAGEHVSWGGMQVD